MLVLVVTAASVAWILAALGLALLLGRGIALRDRQAPAYLLHHEADGVLRSARGPQRRAARRFRSRRRRLRSSSLAA